ncbi:type I secretion system permease/ATPase [Dongia rigui]|uniref:Type I secretion system permease/ATPase n=1 Tax=Dongia rigui TaxID=940149 RepID=A0ABU5DTF9_9PROT|nr:type I secretion system permease/ATPase [Dongia rigui]MDY0870632.1 type I secretion system permease/ATPase [Dongia rigui]
MVDQAAPVQSGTSDAPTETADTGLLCLTLLLRFHGLSVDPKALAHRFAPGPKGLTDSDLLRAARESGLKARWVVSEWRKLAKTPLPAIAETKDGRFFVLAKIASNEAGDAKVLAHDPEENRPVALTRAELEKIWTGRLLLMTKRASLGESFAKFDIAWFIPAILKYKRILAEVLIASFVLQLFALVTPLFFQVIIDKVLVHHGLTTLDVLVIGLAVISLFEVLLGGMRTYIFSHTTNRVDVELGAKLFRHLLSLPLSYFQARRVGDSVARVRELESIRSFLTGNALTLVIDLVFTSVFLAVMWYYSPTLTLVVMAAIPAYVVLSLLVTPIFRRRLDEKFARGAENQSFLVETVTGIETAKAMAVEPRMQRRWEEQLAGYVSAAFRVTKLGNTASQTAQLINKATVLLTLYLGAKAVLNGDLTVGALVAFNMLANQVHGPVLRLAQMWQDFQQVRISVNRLGDILNAPTEPLHRADKATPPSLTGRISFDHVIFRYRPDAPEVLSDLSLDILPGQMIGIVGSSGSGKSTLTKLVQRLFVPERGRVLIDGMDLALIDPAWLRRQIGVVLQENVLFTGSIRENIALADPGMPMDRVVGAAKLAGAHDFILELPQGYDTVLGERGASLSGGQRQRMAIARALVSNPKILIFDEATSALDYESERIIQDNMAAIARGRTVLIIAHRLSAVRACHRILTIEKGRLVEDGSHGELIQRNGRYAQLYRYQAADAAVGMAPQPANIVRPAPGGQHAAQ